MGPDYAHAEARKSPALDGKVERDSEGKEIRYPVILSNAEKLISRKVCLAFKQTVCGFDLLRYEPEVCHEPFVRFAFPSKSFLRTKFLSFDSKNDYEELGLGELQSVRWLTYDKRVAFEISVFCIFVVEPFNEKWFKIFLFKLQGFLAEKNKVLWSFWKFLGFNYASIFMGNFIVLPDKNKAWIAYPRKPFNSKLTGDKIISFYSTIISYFT